MTFFKRTLAAFLLATTCTLLADTNKPAASQISVPELSREFRAVWVATVANIDWPSSRGLSSEKQQQELIEILDRCKQLNLNAVIMQVRPACDALYASDLEPWSEYLTGEIGKAPEPYYDPLEFAIAESHQRGMELHAWINPYRAGFKSSKSIESPNHLRQTHSDLVLTYGKHLWLDPGKTAVQDHVMKVIDDIVKRYDVDGIHMDDYFYPYRERGEDGKLIDFPDEPTFMEYVGEGGEATLDDWRRENVNKLIERCYKSIKSQKPWVKFGVSPFGIWQPGHPKTIAGMNSFQEIYCDSLKWLTNGWADYFSPQLYWKIDAVEQSYPTLLKWWSDNNVKGRHMWPGNFTSRVHEVPSEKEKRWSTDEIINQIKTTREQTGAGGNVHFSMKPFVENRAKLNDELLDGVYSQPALIPATTWLSKTTPARPDVSLTRDAGEVKLSWTATDKESVFQWVLQKRVEGKWLAEIHPADTTSFSVKAEKEKGTPDAFAVLVLNRYGVASSPAIVENRP